MESDLFSIFGIKSRIREKRSQRRTITTLTTNSEESFYNNNNNINNKDGHQILFIDSNNSQDQLNRILVKNQNDSESEILSVLYFVLVCTVCIAFVALVIMVYCCLKRRNSYKSTPNDLASLTTTLTATNITSHHHHHHYSSTLTTTTTSGIITSSSSSNSPIVQQHQQSGSDRFISSSNHHHQISSSESQSGTTTTAPTFLFSDPTPAAHYRPPLAITTAPAAVAVASQSSVQQQPPTSVINNSSSLMTTSTSTNTNSQSSTSSSSSSTSTSNYSTSSFCSSSSTTSMKTPLKELCITIPTAKPSLNEAKPQLSIEAKLKTKSLYESKSLFNKRRGSNNSLTLTLTPIKKKLSISSPSKECSTLEYLSKASRTLSIPELIEISKDNNNLYNEFYLIPFNHPEVIVNGSSMKNRYKTIVPNESSRVKLPMRDNDPLTTYINANYINGYKGEPRAYIASQGPMSNTIGDFWRMVWSERVSSVVMITKLIERNKSKCELYIPEQCMQAVCYDSDIWVMVNHVTSYADYEVRQLTVRAGNEAPRVLYHYWYTAWPDHNLPEQPDSLIKLIKQVESVNAHAPSVAVQSKYDENNMLVDVVDVVMMDESSSSTDSTAVQPTEASSSSRGPILVHCSAGVGRTGCFLALSLGIRQLDAESMVDVVQIVCSLRKDRGGMIQTLEQYEFIYQVLAYYCIYYKKQHQQIQQQQQQQAQSQAHNHHHHHTNNQSRHHLVSPASSTTTTSSQSPLNQSTIEAPPSSSSSSSSSASSSSSNAFSTTSTFSFNHSSISVSIPAAIPPTPSPQAPNEPNAFVFP